MSGSAISDDSDGSYEVIDYSDNPLYLILSAIFMDDSGKTLCDHIALLTRAVEKNTEAIKSKKRKDIRS